MSKHESNMIHPEDAELIQFAFNPDEAQSELKIGAAAVATLNESLQNEQDYFETAFADTINQFTTEQQMAIRVMFCHTFRRGLTLGSRLRQNQSQGEQ